MCFLYILEAIKQFILFINTLSYTIYKILFEFWIYYVLIFISLLFNLRTNNAAIISFEQIALTRGMKSALALTPVN